MEKNHDRTVNVLKEAASGRTVFPRKKKRKDKDLLKFANSKSIFDGHLYLIWT